MSEKSVFMTLKLSKPNLLWLFADAFSFRQSTDLSVTYHFSHAFKGSDSQKREKNRGR